MNRGWIVAGMIGALGLGFGLGRLGGFEPPREMEAPRELPSRGGDRVTPQEVSVKDTGEGLEFSTLSEDEMFVVGYGDAPRRWRPVPPDPDSVNVPKKDLGDLWGVIGVRAKPCHCTPVDPPPGWLQGFFEQTSRVADFCDECDSFRSQCQDDARGDLGARCNSCARICWGESTVDPGDPGEDPEG